MPIFTLQIIEAVQGNQSFEKLLIDEPKLPKQGPTLLIIDTEALTDVSRSRPKAA